MNLKYCKLYGTENRNINVLIEVCYTCVITFKTQCVHLETVFRKFNEGNSKFYKLKIDINYKEITPNQKSFL